MPLQRSPPPPTPKAQPSTTPLFSTPQPALFTPHSSSEPSLNINLDSPNMSPAITFRNAKRLRVEGDEEYSLSATMSELKGMFREFKQQQEETMLATFSHKQEIQHEDIMLKINNIIEQNIELKLSVEVMSAKYDEFLNRISSLEAEKKEDKKRIRQLEDKIEYLERNTRANEIEIRNVPKYEGETKDDLCDLVVNLGQTLNLNISQTNVKDIHRVKSRGSSNPIIVNFNSVITKDKVIKGVKMFNKSQDKGEKLNTTHLKFKNKQPIYVSERLTFNTQKLYYLARTQHKNYGYDFCWTSYGVVYIRKKVGDPQIRINSEEDFQRLRPASCI